MLSKYNLNVGGVTHNVYGYTRYETYTGLQDPDMTYVSLGGGYSPALQQYEHGYNMEAVYDLYDEFIEAGNTMMELIPIVIDVLSVSGYIKMDEPKQAKKKAK
jgi:hypothetical protein